MQNAEESVWLRTRSGSIKSGEEYHVAATFGSNGFQLFLNGRLVAEEAGFTDGLQNNTRDLAIGANTWARSLADPEWTRDFFDGRISGFGIYGDQLSAREIAGLAGRAPEEPLDDPTVIGGVLYGTDAGEQLDAYVHHVNHVQAGYGDDTVTGSSGDDTLQGGHGEDSLMGGDGNDWLVSYADAREPVIA